MIFLSKLSKGCIPLVVCIQIMTVQSVVNQNNIALRVTALHEERTLMKRKQYAAHLVMGGVVAGALYYSLYGKTAAPRADFSSETIRKLNIIAELPSEAVDQQLAEQAKRAKPGFFKGLWNTGYGLATWGWGIVGHAAISYSVQNSLQDYCKPVRRLFSLQEDVHLGGSWGLGTGIRSMEYDKANFIRELQNLENIVALFNLAVSEDAENLQPCLAAFTQSIEKIVAFIVYHKENSVDTLMLFDHAIIDGRIKAIVSNADLIITTLENNQQAATVVDAYFKKIQTNIEAYLKSYVIA